ncbi:MAG: hypothetical protein K9I02_00945 [Haliscomenobacter sp.]|nr:hypothetical protein [Haliscomenobacter sp.]
MGISCPGTPTVKDVDGNTYNTVQIGTQCWTKENLRVTKYRDGSIIPLDESGGTTGNGTGQTWSSRTTGARTVYGHNAANLATYGYLYNWYAVADSKGLCPSGWHAPSDGEWNSLSSYLGNDPGIKLADTSWILAFGKPTNESGFSVKPGGYRDTTGRFSTPLISGNFWSTTKFTSNLFWGRELYSKGNWDTDSYYGASGLSVRCLKDTLSIVSIPSLSTTEISSITTTSATSGGNIISDGGASITARGVVWSTSTNPTITLSMKASNGTGTGSFSSILTNLAPKTTYYVRAYATNSAGTGYGNEITFTTTDSSIVLGIPCPGTPTVKDIDGNTYNTVQIGTQCWTKENLRVSKFRDGSIIPLDESGGLNGNGTGQTWSSRTIGARTVYGHSAANLATYGYLYNWYAATDTKGLCPSGWHVPSDPEWTTLTTSLGGESVAGGKMKSTGTTLWNSPNTGATNESGFSAPPGGYRISDGSFGSIRTLAFFWSATESGFSAWFRSMYSHLGGVYRFDNYLKSSGASVRCLKDSITTITTWSLPTISTTQVTGIASTTATSGGTITADGGASITARGVVWSTTTNPIITLSTKTSNGTGTGSFSSILTNLAPKTTYYVRAYATNSAGTGYGNEITFTTSDSTIVMGIPCPGTPTVKDIDGNTYNTVQIGTQCWTKENLRVTKYRDGSVIPLDESGGTAGNGTGQTWGSKTTGARTVNGHSAANLATYGYLYNWYSVADTKGLCPNGWNVPSEAEWKTLTTFLGGEFVAGGKMKANETTYWNGANSGATNESGFSARPGGCRYNEGSFEERTAFFWSSSEFITSNAWLRYLNIFRSSADNYNYYKSLGASVRCLKDTSSIVSIPTLTTSAITAITTTSATSGGNITSEGGASITSRGVVWSTSTNPTITLTTKTSDGTGTGSFTSLLTNLTPKTTYYVRAYATNSAGTGYGNEITFTTSDSTIVMGIPCPGTPTVKDIDGNIYNTVQIGTQCWTKENLRVTKYRDGTIIPLDESGGTTGNGTGETWSSRTTSARTVYGHSAANLATYGYLYNWYAVTDSKGLCPSGWYVPSNSEWTVLNNFLGGSSVAGGKLKATGTANWNSPNIGASNESGFTVLPGGRRYSSDGFVENTDYAFFWSSTEYDNISSFSLYIASGAARLFRNGTNKFGGITENKDGFSVRCIKDNNKTDSLATLVTASITGINSSSATSGGYIYSDRGAVISARGVVWSTTPSPTIAVSTKTSNGSGTGFFTSTLTNLTPKTTYYVRAYGTNNSITEYGNEISFITSDSTNVLGIPCQGTPSVKDIDGNTYNTVQIGTQCWTKENLKVTRYRDGMLIPLDESGGSEGNGSDQTWSSRTTGTRTVNKSTASNVEIFTTYGYLYNWYAVADRKGLCPSGWHVPSDSEWKKLIDFLGGERVAGGKLKSTGTTLWNNPNTRATNESGFLALPGGCRYSNGLYFSLGYDAFFWSATDFDFTIAWYQDLHLGDSSIISDTNNKTFGASVRCLKDTFSIVSIPTLTTTSITAVSTSSATSGGNITSGGGASITARGVVWSTSTNPTIALTTKTTDGSGTDSFTSSLTNLAPKTTYYVRAYATNSAGTGYGNEISFTTAEAIMNIPCPGTPTVKDIDGNVYNTVQVGTQCWTKENLRVTKYRDGSVIPLDESNSAGGELDIWQDITIGARSIYGNNIDNLRDYGYLYNGYSVLDSKGICPDGWHIPAYSEWSELTNYLGGRTVAGGKMKSTGWSLWRNSSEKATNESGFSALPGGYRVFNGAFLGIKGEAFFWSLSYFPYSESNLLISTLTFIDNSYYGGGGIWRFGAASIRCLKDTSLIKNSPTVSTDSTTIQNKTSVSSGGLVMTDGGSSILNRGVVWSTQPSPTISLNTKTVNGNGIGSFVSILDDLLPSKKYYFRAYATNSIGTSYGNELSFITPDSIVRTGKPCYRDSIAKDIDGNIYNNVQIGNQCWLRENLRVTRYQDGSVIPFDESGGVLGNDSNQSWGNRIEGSRTIYSNNRENFETYGYLYNWYAMVDERGICPKGWHIPSNEEWNILIKQLDSQADLISNSFQSEVAGGKLKSTGTTLWSSPNKGATDESGFHALPGGFRSSKGSFYGIGSTAYYWSTTKVQGGIGAWHRKLTFFEGNIKRSADVSNDQSKSIGFSARCLMD